jgi:hypothetical protein
LIASPSPAARAQNEEQPPTLSQNTVLYLPLAFGPPPRPTPVSFWGMNAYLTKRERISARDSIPALAAAARDAGVQWTREELPWDLIEPDNGRFITVYDTPLRQTREAGFQIIGMLLTTPRWARDGACANDFWCPPADVNEYAQFASWMVERYDGDGVADAPGSPRIAAWQIWNEPNDTALWPDIGGDPNARKRRYGELLVAAYNAIKAADPTATVLIGGTYIYDGSCAGGICDGFNFLNAAGGVFQQVPAARQAFDVFAVHPFIPTARPDDPNIPRLITVEGRLRAARNWLNDPAIGRPNAPIWVTEIGWCTAPGACPGGVAVGEEEQANYLVRSIVIAQQTGVQHVSWFQLEDAFNNPNREWGNAAILRAWDGAGYPAKPAYNAYRTLANQLRDVTLAGTGPVHSHVFDPARPLEGSGGIYNYRYNRGGAIVDVLWLPAGSAQVNVPVVAGRSVTLVDRDGGQTPLAPGGGSVRVTVSERPVFIVQN